jgi:hypothetical protein
MTDYKFEAGKTYKLRGGGTAEILKVGIKTNYGETIAGVAKCKDGSDNIFSWLPNGCVFLTSSHDYDLLPPEPERVSLWMNVYPFDQPGMLHLFSSRTSADLNSTNRRTHVAEWIYEDGVAVSVTLHKVGE